MIDLILLLIIPYHGTCVYDESLYACDLNEHIPNWYVKTMTMKFPIWMYEEREHHNTNTIKDLDFSSYELKPDAMNISWDYLIQNHIIYSTYCGSYWGKCTK